ncbi:sirohydrochlorin chelatase [Streptacidiphilus sp. PAMC 29251]
MGDRAPVLLLAVHGSALPVAAETIGRLVRMLTAGAAVATVPAADVRVGHLDIQRPSLAEALDAVEASPARRAVLVPLLLGPGFHQRVDIPAILTDRHDRGHRLTPGLSGDPRIGRALHDRLRDAERRAGGRADAVVLAGAGSSRPGGNDGVLQAAEHLRARLGRTVPVLPGYCSAAAPTVPAAVEALRAAGHRRIAVSTHLLAPGRFTAGLAQAGAWAVAQPLADHPDVAGLVLQRYRAAASAATSVTMVPPSGDLLRLQGAAGRASMESAA